MWRSLNRPSCLADNADAFLKPGGWVMIAVKSQSIDVTMAPEAVYRQEAGVLRKRGFEVVESCGFGAV